MITNALSKKMQEPVNMSQYTDDCCKNSRPEHGPIMVPGGIYQPDTLPGYARATTIRHSQLGYVRHGDHLPVPVMLLAPPRLLDPLGSVSPFLESCPGPPRNQCTTLAGHLHRSRADY